jgi:hypothetical protein
LKKYIFKNRFCLSNHIIYKQSVTIEVANQQQASKIHEEISDVLKYELPALLEPLFDELAGDDRIIRFDALKIDLKEIAQPNFKYKFKEQLFIEIEKALNETTQTAGYDSNVAIIPTQQSGLDAFIYFLQHGLKPWYVSAKTMKAWAADLTVQFTGTHWQRLADWVKTHYDELIIERLAQQCPEEILYRLIEELSGLKKQEWQPVFDDLLILYDLFAVKPTEGRSAGLWKDSFIAFIKSAPSSEALYTLVKEAYGQRKRRIDITRTVEIQNIHASIQSPLIQQITERLVAGIKQEAVTNEDASYHHKTKEDAAIDVSEAMKDQQENESITANNEIKDISENNGDDAITDNDAINISEQDFLNERNFDETALQQMIEDEEKKSLVKKRGQKTKRPPAVAENEPQYVNNCGIILLHPFLKNYFAELGLINEKVFIGMDACKRAVSLLHFLASGETAIDEFNLLLQKLLCNLPPEETLPAMLDITDKEKEESENLLRSVINYWPPLKNTSVAGLRNTFLQREGKLEKKESGWLLRIEQRTVDILLDKLPWGFSTIRLPWMTDTISVEWC